MLQFRQHKMLWVAVDVGILLGRSKEGSSEEVAF